MATKRGGGFRPPELRGTLGTLIRTTLQQAGVVRDVIQRGAREGRSRIDDARASRRRSDALAELGELVLDLIRRGGAVPGCLDAADEAAHEGLAAARGGGRGAARRGRAPSHHAAEPAQQGGNQLR